MSLEGKTAFKIINLNLLIIKFRTYPKLGFGNLLRVILYKLFRRLGIGYGSNGVNLSTGTFFRTKDFNFTRDPTTEVSKEWTEKGRWFSFHEFGFDGIPDWHANPFQKGVRANDGLPWYKISDFSDEVGDIKTVWEASRFDWVLRMAQRVMAGDENELNKLNEWLWDWIDRNPPYIGANWKCGQEAGIRVMHLAMATLVLEQSETSTENLKELISIHLQRINSTTGYAIAQCNNHAITEAAALLVGGSMLNCNTGEAWSKRGHKLIESQVAKLVSEDGSFSQYSLNYHRLMLDILCMVEIWRRKKDEPKFSEMFYQRAQSASTWLFNLINLANGDGPNVGANDGARLLPLTNTKYRDYRPTLQLSYALFYDQQAIEESGPWDDVLKLLKVSSGKNIAVRNDCFVADRGGFAVFRKGKAMAMLRYPRFRYRPGHADALHLDLWLGDRNILRDGGTYSYNAERKWLNYFSGTQSHNTMQFDDLDQMPRLGRFLFGDWLKTSSLEGTRHEGVATTFGAGYVSRKGIAHHRKISLFPNSLKVVDEVTGFNKKAELRWRLAPGEWELVEEGGGVKTSSQDFPGFVLSVSSNEPYVRCALKEGWESLHYLEKTPLTVLELETAVSCKLTTEIRWEN